MSVLAGVDGQLLTVSCNDGQVRIRCSGPVDLDVMAAHALAAELTQLARWITTRVPKQSLLLERIREAQADPTMRGLVRNLRRLRSGLSVVDEGSATTATKPPRETT